MGNAKYEIADAAYLKAVLHSAKYVSAVSGLLLGEEGTTERVVRIEDTLPLCHSGAQFSPSLAEVALLLARKVADKRGQSVVGVYFGNELADDRSIGVVPTRLADKVRESFSNAVLLMVDAPRLSPQLRTSAHCFRVCTRADTWGKGALPDTALIVSKQALAQSHSLLSHGCAAPYTVTDFEDHCLDPSQDWFNKHVLELSAPPANDDDNALDASAVSS